MDDYETQQARLNKEFLSIKILGHPLISLSIRGVWLLGACIAALVLAWMLGPKHMVNIGDRFNQGFWVLIAYVALVRSVFLKIEKRIEKKKDASKTSGDFKIRFDFFDLIFGGALFFVWAGALVFPWLDIVPSGQPAFILFATVWIFLAYLHSDWFRRRHTDKETE